MPMQHIYKAYLYNRNGLRRNLSEFVAIQPTASTLTVLF
jgi:hypothetical protein